MARPARVVMFQPLEERRMLSTTSTHVPNHVVLARRSVDEVLPANNLYSNTLSNVTWAGINGATLTTNRSDCTTYFTHLLRTAYNFTNTQLRNWTGSPDSLFNLNEYFDAAKINSGFEGFTQINELEIGDLMISDYPDGASARGHIVMINEAPRFVYTQNIQLRDANNNPTTVIPTRVYYGNIIDVSAAVHSNDTRAARPDADGSNDTGVGSGNVAFITDLNGNLIGWRWGASTTASQYVMERYQNLFTKMPPRTNEIRFDPTVSRTVQVEFSNNMDASTIGVTDLKVTNTSTGATFVPNSVSLSADKRTATFVLPASITKGNYSFTLAGSTVKTEKGNTVATNGALSGPDVFYMPGDANRDRNVDFSDLLIVAQNYGTSGKTFAEGNFNYSADGAVDFDDLLILAQNYGTSMVQAFTTPVEAKPTTAAKPRTSLVSEVL